MSDKQYNFDWPLVGNRHITEYLEKTLANGRVGGSYIFSGPDNLGKTTVAMHFAKCLFCQNPENGSVLPCGKCSACLSFKRPELDEQQVFSIHSDFHLIKPDPDKKNIAVEQVRGLINALSMSSFLGSYKIGVIKHAERMSREAANALLKTLEEPKDKVIIILITNEVDALPATIASRCQHLAFRPVAVEIIYDYLIKEKKSSRSEAKNYSALSLGRPALAAKFLEDNEFREKYCLRLDSFLRFFYQDMNERLGEVSALLPEKAMGAKNAREAGRVLEIWLGLARDLVLAEHGNNGLIQHRLKETEINALKSRVSLVKLLDLIKLIQQARSYLSANVNPKLVLENIAINI